jgi:hypothetical protein
MEATTTPIIGQSITEAINASTRRVKIMPLDKTHRRCGRFIEATVAVSPMTPALWLSGFDGVALTLRDLNSLHRRSGASDVLIYDGIITFHFRTWDAKDAFYAHLTKETV